MKLPDDPFVLELLPEFVDTWISDIDSQVHELITTKNSDDLYRLGHTIKGSCSQFGLDDISQMGIKLMSIAREENWEEAQNLVEPLKTAFKHVKIFLEENPPV